jgi:hypothetical protein
MVGVRVMIGRSLAWIQLFEDDAGRRSTRRELAHKNTKCRWRQLRWAARVGFSLPGIVFTSNSPMAARPLLTPFTSAASIPGS